jgi:hypothetical protein
MFFFIQAAQASQPFVGPVHGTAASASLDEYYTAKSARMVTEMYKDDIEALGYEPCTTGVCALHPRISGSAAN